MSPTTKKVTQKPQYLTIDTFSETMSHIVTKKEFEELKTDVEKIQVGQQKIMTVLSNMVGQLNSIQENTTASDYRQGEHGAQLENHEQRISKVEHKLAIAI